jgi:hypothetical protein
MKAAKSEVLNPIAILSKLKKQIPETLSSAWDYCNIWSAMPTADQSTVHSEHPDVVLVCWQRQEDPSFCWNYVQLRFFYGTNVLMLFSYPKLWTMYIYSEKILDQLTNVKGALNPRKKGLQFMMYEFGEFASSHMGSSISWLEKFIRRHVYILSRWKFFSVDMRN